MAGLARIALTPEEKTNLQKDLEKILNYVSELKEVDTSEKPGATISDREFDSLSKPINVMRQDMNNLSSDDSSVKEILEGVPKKRDKYFSVKRILDNIK
jgi:aspartyl-tRNA(Asn)/glutamyl-tRNA(Gln) amidotransferase subunit C